MQQIGNEKFIEELQEIDNSNLSSDLKLVLNILLSVWKEFPDSSTGEVYRKIKFKIWPK